MRLSRAVDAALRVFLFVCVLAAAIAGAPLGCFLPAGDPCCRDDLECVDGARCFEGRCALRCDDDFECAEGELCTEPAGVCRVADPNVQLDACPYEQVSE